MKIVTVFVMSRRSLTSLGTLLIAALVIILWGSALLVPTPMQEEPVRVAVGMWPGNESWILARDAGDLDFREVNLVEMNWTSAAMRAVGNRVVDAAVLSLDEVIRQIQQGYPLKIIAVLDISKGADLVMVRQGISAIADLRGRRIGYEPRTSGAWLLSKALMNANLKLGDVEPVPVNPAEVEEIFNELKLDGVVLAEPWRERMNALSLTQIYDSSLPGASIVRVLAVNPDALNERRDALRSLVQAHFKWMPKLRQSEEIPPPVLRREGLTNGVFRSVLERVESVDLERNRRLLHLEEPWLGALFMHLQESLIEGVSNASKVAPSDVFEPSILEELP